MSLSPGTNLRWLAPELLNGDGSLSTHSDVWSYGMVLLEIMTGLQPYSGMAHDTTVVHELANGSPPSRPEGKTSDSGVTDDLWKLMQSCWAKRADSRPSMTIVRGNLAKIQGGSTSGICCDWLKICFLTLCYRNATLCTQVVETGRL